MRYRPLGDSGIEVSEIALGSWLTFGSGIPADRAVACVDAAFEAGINLIDTANAYGRGAAALDLVPHAAKFVSSQPQSSLLHREPEREVIPLCAANGISQIVWSPLAQGVLTGKYRPGAAPPSDSRMASREMNAFMDRYD